MSADTESDLLKEKEPLQACYGIFEWLFGKGLLSKEQLNDLLKPENRIVPGK